MWLLVRLVCVAVLLGAGLGVAEALAVWTGGSDGLPALAALGPVIGSPGASLHREAVVGGAAAGAVAVAAPVLGRAVSQLTTLVHELGHTVVAGAVGARPSGIVLRHDASGHATARWVGRPTPLRRLALGAVAFAGLPAPAVASLVGAQLLVGAGPRVVLWSLAAAGAVVALLARSAWSLLVAVGLLGAGVAALTEAAQPWAAAGAVAVIVATGLASLLLALRGATRPLSPGDDARVVARALWLPARLVRLLQAGLIVTLVATTGWVLLAAVT